MIAIEEVYDRGTKRLVDLQDGVRVEMYGYLKKIIVDEEKYGLVVVPLNACDVEITMSFEEGHPKLVGMVVRLLCKVFHLGSVDESVDVYDKQLCLVRSVFARRGGGRGKYVVEEIDPIEGRELIEGGYECVIRYLQELIQRDEEFPLQRLSGSSAREMGRLLEIVLAKRERLRIPLSGMPTVKPENGMNPLFNRMEEIDSCHDFEETNEVEMIGLPKKRIRVEEGLMQKAIKVLASKKLEATVTLDCRIVRMEPGKFSTLQELEGRVMKLGIVCDTWNGDEVMDLVMYDAVGRIRRLFGATIQDSGTLELYALNRDVSVVITKSKVPGEMGERVYWRVDSIRPRRAGRTEEQEQEQEQEQGHVQEQEQEQEQEHVQENKPLLKNQLITFSQLRAGTDARYYTVIGLLLSCEPDQLPNSKYHKLCFTDFTVNTQGYKQAYLVDNYVISWSKQLNATNSFRVHMYQNFYELFERELQEKWFATLGKGQDGGSLDQLKAANGSNVSSKGIVCEICIKAVLRNNKLNLIGRECRVVTFGAVKEFIGGDEQRRKNVSELYRATVREAPQAGLTRCFKSYSHSFPVVWRARRWCWRRGCCREGVERVERVERKKRVKRVKRVDRHRRSDVIAALRNVGSLLRPVRGSAGSAVYKATARTNCHGIGTALFAILHTQNPTPPRPHATPHPTMTEPDLRDRFKDYHQSVADYNRILGDGQNTAPISATAATAPDTPKQHHGASGQDYLRLLGDMGAPDDHQDEPELRARDTAADTAMLAGSPLATPLASRADSLPPTVATVCSAQCGPTESPALAPPEHSTPAERTPRTMPHELHELHVPPARRPSLLQRVRRSLSRVQ
ncbi:hypothetical protein TBLA_0B00620 [Henningerozyma blattae CBS 6284]|uniref:Telomeric single stranded DNA binding POT1/Cdc13 domain-containing protein n=1 Tax=Henningerozyma blattae (strain ATCC 34711 / CBS 6284 / DSM 70876 / NBRC 10599 / NRRL Y-10934 / UCD 77-7) TaxID=1071380 RepID=I2GXQ3_HENB6|nr:hypothetical protein TBLA_0B00620 [Tetrapisispora blattae CBS 6284]CCH58905.1 hypothetical protein TBLA_0B00620 [Tetrapisispora blattae CBS 6284]